MLSSQNSLCFFLQPWFPLNTEQMLEIQGFSSTAHYHLNAGMLYSSFLLLFNLPALLITITYRLTQKLCKSLKVKIHIAEFIHYLNIWVLYSDIFFPFKNIKTYKYLNVLNWTEGGIWVLLSCIAKARHQLIVIRHGHISQFLFSAYLFMWFFFCVFYTHILQEAAFLWNISWIFQLFPTLIAYVHVLDFFTCILNTHGSCGNHSWLPLKDVMTLP